MRLMLRQGGNEFEAADQFGVARITRRLTDEFGGAHAPGLIEQFVSEFLDEMTPTAKITAFLPLLAERSVRNRLRSVPPDVDLRPTPPAIAAATDRDHRACAQPANERSEASSAWFAKVVWVTNAPSVPSENDYGVGHA